MKTFRSALLGLAVLVGGAMAATGASAIDNSSIGKPEFREHKATYGLVYRLPKDVTDILDNKIYPPLRERLDEAGSRGRGTHFQPAARDGGTYP